MSQTASSPTIPYDANRFRSTAEFYDRYRQPYPDELIEAVARGIGLGAGDRLLDLGCGPGPLAIGFARLGLEVTAVDPEASMLDAARAGAEAAGVSLTVMEGSSYDLSPAMGRFRAVTMGRCFHWMDRVATLKTLEDIIEPGGAVVLFEDRRVSSRPDWRVLIEEIGQKYTPESFASRRMRQQPDWAPHEAVLLGSTFKYLEVMGRVVLRALDADDIIGQTYSRSVTSPAALGEALPAFEAELRSALSRLSPTGLFQDVVEVRAVLAFREGGAGD